MPGRWRLLIVWGLFAGWVGWLGWQSFRGRDFPVVSRAQLLNAHWVVVAEVAGDAEGRAKAEAKIVEVLVFRQKSDTKFETPQFVTISNLPGCAGYTKPGRYVLPLTQNPFKLAEFSRSPLMDSHRFKPQIYPDEPVVRTQIIDAMTGSH